jgi:hypothetical protein
MGDFLMKKKGIKEEEFLNYIYKNAEMGLIGIDDVIKKVEDNSLLKVLEKERKQYKEILKEAKVLLNRYGKCEEEINIMAKLGSKIMSEMVLLKDHSKETIAKMMIEGTNKGIIAIVEKINGYNNNDASIVVLANKFKNTLEMNMDELKKYL